MFDLHNRGQSSTWPKDSQESRAMYLDVEHLTCKLRRQHLGVIDAILAVFLPVALKRKGEAEKPPLALLLGSGRVPPTPSQTPTGPGGGGVPPIWVGADGRRREYGAARHAAMVQVRLRPRR